ncbi:hypothetical protein LTR66_012445 [Elasticomyces elasticus]|nr:hypothetical protein LTR66_012445 [Elasticomyces elasticus]
MSTTIWPPAPPSSLLSEQCSALSRELTWLLRTLHDQLPSLKATLESCHTLLSSDTPSTLALSSQRSEALKGFVVRTGARVVKGDVQLRLPSLPPPRGQNGYKLTLSGLPTAPALVLGQLVRGRECVGAALDVVDATAWTGDAGDAGFIDGQLRLLYYNIREAEKALKGGEEAWNEEGLDEKGCAGELLRVLVASKNNMYNRQIFDPPLPQNISFHLSIAEAALVLHIRTLEPVQVTGTSTPSSFATTSSFSGFGLRDRLAVALGGTRTPLHDEANDVFAWRGQDVRVREKVRVESQDPSLMAAMAKLRALGHSVARWRRALDVVLGKEEEDSDEG